MSTGNGDKFCTHWGTGLAGSNDMRDTSLEVPQYESPPMIMTNLSGGGPAVQYWPNSALVVMVVFGVVVVVVVVVVLVVVHGVSRSCIVKLECLYFFTQPDTHLRSKQCPLCIKLILTPNWHGSYPPDTWILVSATLSGIMFGIIVSFRALGEVVNPGKNKLVLTFIFFKSPVMLPG